MVTRFAFVTALSGAVSGLSLGASPSQPLPRPDEIVDRLRQGSEPGSSLAGSRREVFERMLDGRPYPGGCATPLLLALEQARPPLEGESAAMFRRLGPSGDALPPLATSQPHPSPGSFRLRAGAERGRSLLEPEDGDLDGVPDEATRLLERLDLARREVLWNFEQTGTPVSRPDGDEPIHEVEIAELPGTLAGYVWSADGPPVLILDSRRVKGVEGDAVLRHQIAHLLQLELTSDESPWWYEAHAVWAEDPRGFGAGARAGAVASYLNASSGGFEPRAIEAWEGSFLWPHYLLGSGAPSVLGMAWEEMASLPGNNTRQAMDSALARTRGTTLEEEVRAFRIWNVFLGEMDDGAHYPFAGDLQAASSELTRRDAGGWSGRGPMAVLGGEVLQLTADPAPGGWRMHFEGDPRVRWDVSLVTLPSWLGGRPGLAVMEVVDGLGSAAIPWQDLSGVFAVVQNLGSEKEGASSFSLQASYDELVPFDLMSFSAGVEGGGTVALRWHTEREIDLLGWRLYRSRAAFSGFEPINALLIPSVGGPDETAYMFLDEPPVTGRKYYYLLEGVTELGFRETSYPVGVRLPRQESSER